MSDIKISTAAPSNDWVSATWRPMMGWMYMAVCIFDFIIFPILWTIIQSYDHHSKSLIRTKNSK